MAETPWHFARDGKQEGPVDESELVKLFAEGQLFGDTLVWCEDFDDWKPASSVPVFAAKLKKKPPPLPPGTTAPPKVKFTASQAITAAPPPIKESGKFDEPAKAHAGANPSPGGQPSVQPSVQPAVQPSVQPSVQPAAEPSVKPSVQPSMQPSIQPAAKPQNQPAATGKTATPAPAPAPKPQPQAPSFSGEEVLRPHPWHRFFARLIDYYWSFNVALLPAVLICLIAGMAFRDSSDMRMMFGFLAFSTAGFVWMMLEPLMLMMFGTTLGKALYNIRLRQSNGTRLTPGQAISRSFWVWVFGGGIVSWLPFGTLIAMVVDYQSLTKNGITRWDREGKYRYEHHPMSGGRWAGVAAAIFFGAGMPGMMILFCVSMLSIGN